LVSSKYGNSKPPLFPRVGSAVAGLIVIVASLFIDPPLFNLGWLRTPTGTSYVMDQLASIGQRSDVDIYIADKLAGRIVLDAPGARKFIDIDVTGKVEQYRLEGTAVVKINGKDQEIKGTGSGTIDLTRPAVFAIHVEGKAGDIYALSLAKESP
jgi:hypothetical protein